MGVAVEVDGLGVRFRRRGHRAKLLGLRGPKFWALQDVSFTVEPGEAFGIIGRNGSGKTTMLQTIAGVIPPTVGEVSTAGRVSSLVELSAGASRDLTARENLQLQGVMLGMSRAEVRARWDEIVAFTGLSDDVLDAPMRTLSQGMILRLGFSIVVHTDPAVLLVDEVLAVGDDAFQAQCIDRVAELRHGGCAVVLVTHDLDLVHTVCDRTALFDAGRLAAIGPTEAIVRQYVEVSRGPVPPEH
jgi:ABC-type polysaccharide/polyol phosphate transport system ATPase subunit